MSRAPLTCAILALAALPCGAAEAGVHALTGGRIVTAPGRVVPSGTIVLRDGIIDAVGADVVPPPDARIWDLDGATVYPGLIDAYTLRSWPEPKKGEGAPDHPASDAPNPLIHPERDITSHASDETAARRLRAAGFTTVVVAPRQGLLRGTSVLLNLGDGPLAENLVARGVAQNVTLRSNPWRGGYPDSLMGAVALFRQTLLDAGWYARAWSAYRRNPAQRRPPVDAALEALAPVVTGRQVVVFETDGPLATLRVARLVDELGLHAWVVGNGREYERLPEIAATELPHLLPLAYPEKPAVGEADDLSVSLEELRAWDLAPDDPQRLLAAGVTVAFVTGDLDDPGRLWENLARSLARGLTAEQALAALTTTPARLLGIDDRAGTIAPGMMADLTVVDGELFVAKPKIRALWIDGRRYAVESGSPPAVEPAGRWELAVETRDGQTIAAVVELAGTADSLAGSVTALGQSTPLTGAAVSGSTLTLDFSGASFGISGAITMTLEITGDRASGSGTSSRGDFSVHGMRTSAPPAAEVSPQPRAREIGR